MSMPNRKAILTILLLEDCASIGKDAFEKLNEMSNGVDYYDALSYFFDALDEHSKACPDLMSKGVSYMDHIDALLANGQPISLRLVSTRLHSLLQRATTCVAQQSILHSVTSEEAKLVLKENMRILVSVLTQLLESFPAELAYFAPMQEGR